MELIPNVPKLITSIILGFFIWIGLFLTRGAMGFDIPLFKFDQTGMGIATLIITYLIWSFFEHKH